MIHALVESVTYCESFFSLLTIVCLLRAKEFRTFATLSSLLVVHLTATCTELVLLELVGKRVVPTSIGYPIYFYFFWISFAVEATLSLYVILSIFRSAMAPLKGLRTLGMVVFRWAAGISVALAFAISFSPHQSATSIFARILSQFQQISGVITLCLLLFVCFAIKPLGLTYRSRVFGVALGLGITAASTLIGAAWVAHQPQLYSTVSVWTSAAHICGLLVWSAYFALPEEKRRIIVLPTTSPFLRWNQISEVLGDAPGFVAIAGIPPELFSPAEIEIMTRASIQMQRLSEFDPLPNSASTISGLSA